MGENAPEKKGNVFPLSHTINRIVIKHRHHAGKRGRTGVAEGVMTEVGGEGGR